MTVKALNEAEEVEISAAARRTATFQSAAVDIRDYEGDLMFLLASSAGGGTTPTMDAVIEHSPDGVGSWVASGVAFAQVTDAADAFEAVVRTIDDLDPFIRANVTIAGGTPTFDMVIGAVGFKKTR